jgi:hypothetical protein
MVVANKTAIDDLTITLSLEPSGLQVWVGAEVFEQDGENYPEVGLQKLLNEFIQHNIGGVDCLEIDAPAAQALRLVLTSTLAELEKYRESSDPEYFGR